MTRRPLVIVALAFWLLAAPAHAQDATRPVAFVFAGGYGTDLPLATAQFAALRATLTDRAPDALFAQYSYTGTTFSGCDAQPSPYARVDTAQDLAVSVRVMRETLQALQDACHVDRVAIIGHSLGGLIAFNALADQPVPNVTDLVTLDSPLGGMPAPLVETCLSIDFCPAGPITDTLGQLFVQSPDNAARAATLADAGVHMSAWGNESDCFYNVAICAPFARALLGPIDARESQWLGIPALAVVRKNYPAAKSLAAISASHTAILKNAAAELALALVP